MNHNTSDHSPTNDVPQSLIQAISISKQLDIVNSLISNINMHKQSTDSLNNFNLAKLMKKAAKYQVLPIGNLYIYNNFALLSINTPSNEFFHVNNIQYVKNILIDQGLQLLFLLDSRDKVYVFSISDNQTYLWWNEILPKIESYILYSLFHDEHLAFRLNDESRIEDLRVNVFRLVNLIKKYVGNDNEDFIVKLITFYQIQKEFRSFILTNLRNINLAKNLTVATITIEMTVKELSNVFFSKKRFVDFIVHWRDYLLLLDMTGLTISFILPYLRSSKTRNINASFYTPINLIVTLVENSMDRLFSQNGGHDDFNILDPSMGTGVILLFILEWLAQNIYSAEDSIINARKHLMGKYLYGYEIDKETLKLANFLLNDFCDNLSNSWIPNLQAKDFISEFIIKAKKGSLSRRFDLIITNPPYISLHSRFVKNTLNPQDKILLRSFIPEFSGKRDNYYLYFLGISLKILNKGGFLSFVIDHSFFDLPSYGSIRKHILNNYSIKYLLNEFDYRPEATVDLGILILQNICPNPRCFVYYQNDINSKVITLDQNSFSKRPHHSFDYFIHQDIVDQLSSRCIKLGEICRISCGLEYGGLLKKHFLSSEPTSKNWHPVLDGSNSLPSKFIRFWIPGMQNSYVRFDKEFERNLINRNKNFSKTGKKVILISGNIERFHKRKIVLRQSAREFIGIIDDKKYLSLRNTHLIFDVKEPYTLEFILGFMSSCLGDWLGINLNIIRSSGKNRYPQIRLRDLERLPIPNIKKCHSEKLYLIKRVENLVSESLSAGVKINLLLNSIWKELQDEDRDRLKPQKKFIKSCFKRNISKQLNFSKTKYIIEPLLEDIAHLLRGLEKNETQINSAIFDILEISTKQRNIIEGFFTKK